MNVAELLTIPAEMFPGREILRFEGASLSYAELADRTAAAALGIEPGRRVAVLEANTPGVVAALFGTAAIGGVFAPLSFRARGPELADLLETAAPDLLLAGARYLEQARAAAPASTRVAPLVEDAGSGERPLEPVAVDGLPAALMFTSGTTSRPKGVLLGHASLVEYVLSTTDPAGDADAGSVLVAAPLHHIAGLTAVLSATFAGRRIVLMRQFDAGEWLRLVEEERVTRAFVVPTMLRRILEHERFRATDLSSLEVLGYGAAPMPLAVIRRALDELPPTVRFVNAFGQTETASTVTTLTPDDHRLEGSPAEVEAKVRRLASVGRPLPDVELRVVDEHGGPRAEGEVGEIVVRIHDGWLRTGDLAWIDDAGYVFLAGRLSDTIIRGGENIAPQEIEAVLESHEAVEEAAVVGVPDEEWGERVAAAVVPRAEPPVSAGELVEFCRARIAGHKRPDRIVFVGSLPRNALGKVIRAEVRMLFDDERSGIDTDERDG